VIVFGDDQYENFREDGVPAFQINCFESFEARPWEHPRPGPNAWNEAPDTVFRYQANRRAAKHLVTRLIEAGFKVAYAYQPPQAALPAAMRCRRLSPTPCFPGTAPAAASTPRSGRS